MDPGGGGGEGSSTPPATTIGDWGGVLGIPLLAGQLVLGCSPHWPGLVLGLQEQLVCGPKLGHTSAVCVATVLVPHGPESHP